jgi:hypothetical protein
VSDLTEFLLARIAEDEAAARRLLVTAQRTSLTLADPKWLGLPAPGWYAWPEVEAMCTRTIADGETKRRVIAELTEDPMGNHEWWWDRDVSGPLLALMALPYADHPDYRAEWRP